MANPHKGDVSFEADGKTYTLRFSAHSLCELEEAFGKGILAIGAEMAEWEKDPGKIKMTAIRTIIWAGLRDHHPEIDLLGAGELVQEAGGIPAAFALMSKAFEQAFPAKTKGARPPKKGQPRSGTGPNT